MDINKKTSLFSALFFGVLFSAPSHSMSFDQDTEDSIERSQFLKSVNSYLYKQSIDHFDLIERADRGDKEASWYVSQMYHQGILLDKNPEKAEKYARLAGLNGNDKAQDYLSRHPDLDRQEQLLWANKSAAANNAKSLFYLGKSFIEADGVPRDIDLALFYLSRSSDLGYKPAIRLRQDILDQQIELPSFEDILENARSGQIDALKRLAEAYRNGILIDRDISKAELIEYQIEQLVEFEANHTVNGYE